VSYTGFDKLKRQLAHKPGVTDPGALAASIGRAKYGAKKFQKAAGQGKSLRNATPRRKALAAWMERHGR